MTADLEPALIWLPEMLLLAVRFRAEVIRALKWFVREQAFQKVPAGHMSHQQLAALTIRAER
jgi:hypothetical protein